jgi:hypothetical protein
MIIDAERLKPDRKRSRAHRLPGDHPRTEDLHDLPGEKAAGQENAPVGDPDSGAHEEAGGGAAPSSDVVGSGGTGSRHVPVPGVEDPLSAEELLQKIGQDFLADYRQDTAKAWENLLLAMMSNLKVLAESALVAPVRDLINIAKDVEDQIRKFRTVEAKTPDGDRRLPMDQIGAQWRLELPSDGSTQTVKKTNSRPSHASSSKSKTSKESASSSEKTSSETNGSEP